ncbi:MAG: hypothetical protein U0263_36815 [Polyangiaceae bacterium]
MKPSSAPRRGFHHRLAFVALAGAFVARTAAAEHAARVDEPRPYFVGTSLFVLANLVPSDEPPGFYQLNLGRRLTPSDSLSLELVTWKYYRPLGIPWGSGRESDDKKYPGFIREYGGGPAYQRFLWKGSYVSLSALSFWRQYYDTNDRKLGDGFQLFMTLRLGYHFCFFERLFVEPNVAFTAWPVKTNVPEGFAVQDRRWPSYFLFEPGLHVGVEL